MSGSLTKSSKSILYDMVFKHNRDITIVIFTGLILCSLFQYFYQSTRFMGGPYSNSCTSIIRMCLYPVRIWDHLLDITSTGNNTIIITTDYIEEARQAHVVSF